MDRRNWPWRKKSSEKILGETQSLGSISSYSERLSDEQANLTYILQSPEVASATALDDDDENEMINSLTDKLSASLVDITAKEELVKQHAKVAEEAVAGWERAEKEVSSLKLQLEAALKKNSAVDGALKECVRQLRQGKEDQERRVEERIEKRAREWEFTKSELENQIKELNTQLEAAKYGATPSLKLEADEKEKTSMRLELVALTKKLEIATIERDLSTQSAENASKQHLESVKKIAKIEAECRSLRFLTRNVSLPSHKKSVTGSSATADALTDTQVDYGERLQTLENSVARSSEKVLMDDFLEMERLAAFPDTKNGMVSRELVGSSNTNGENPLKAEIEEMVIRNADLEENIRRLETEKLDLDIQLSKSQGQLKEAKVRSVELESQLAECQNQLRTSNGQLKGTKTELISLQNNLHQCQDELRKSQAKLKSTETELIEIQTQLIEHEDQLNYSEAHMKDADAKLEDMRSHLNDRDDQFNISQGQLKKAEASLMDLQMQLNEREEQLKTSQTQQEHLEDELMKLQTRLLECENQLRISQGQLENSDAELIKLKAELLACEEELKKSQGQVRDIDSQLLEMQNRVIEYEDKLDKSQEQTKYVDAKLIELQMELKESIARREEAESQVNDLESEVKSLVHEADKERALSAEIMIKCSGLESELSKRKLEPLLQLAWNGNTNMQAEQEKELAVAASKLEECKKTIASLGRQLQSLATLDDFLEDEDGESCLEFSGESPIFFRTGEVGKPPSIDCQ